MTGHEVAAHEQAQSHHYMMHFPPHPARKADPHYVDFDHYHRQHRATARCYIGERIGYGDCRDAQFQPCPPPENGGQQPGLELHHSHVEFSLQNGVDLAALEKDYPGISDPGKVGEWVESAANFRWLCLLARGITAARLGHTLRAIVTTRPANTCKASSRRTRRVRRYGLRNSLKTEVRTAFRG